MELEKLIINGTTQFSRSIANLIKRENAARIIAFTTKRSLIDEQTIDGIPIIPFEDLSDCFDSNNCKVLNTIGYSKMNALRETVNKEIEQTGFRLYTFISNSASIYSDKIGQGCIIMPDVYIGSNVKIGHSCIIDAKSSLTHDIIIEDNVYVASGVIIGGNVVVGKNSFIGLGSTIKNKVRIASFTLVGCGSNVIRNISTSKMVVIGNPAQELKGKESTHTL